MGMLSKIGTAALTAVMLAACTGTFGTPEHHAEANDNTDSPSIVTGIPSQDALKFPSPVNSEREMFKYFPQGAASIQELCLQNRGADKFTDVFCSPNLPVITSLAQLNAALGLTNAANVSCTTASGSLVKAETSALNPRCIRFSQPGYDPNAVAVAYLRSNKTFAEVVARDPVLGMRFYLIKFDLACETTGTCTPADYMTQSAESNWRNVSVYEDTQLKNTPLDCTSCHQPRGPNSQKALLMVETADPWAHWLRSNRPCGQQLLVEYMGAHQNEAQYANLTPAQVSASDPAKLQAFVENNGFFGPEFGNNIYESALILYESGGTPGSSATWQSLYNQRVSGANRRVFGGTAIPYPDCTQSDSSRLPAMTQNFIGVSNGSIPKSQSKLLFEVNLNTPDALAKRFLAPAATTMTAQQIMANACLSCHNSSLDQSLSRARFNAEDLSRNSAYIYGVAMGRIRRGDHDLRRMPPPTFMNLTEQHKITLLEFFASQGGT